MPKGGKKQEPKGPQLRGPSLFAFIYDELSRELGDEFSTEELLQAANALIKLSRHEYIERVPPGEKDRPDYRTDDICHAFENRTWQILKNEIIDDSWENDDLGLNFDSLRKVRDFLRGPVR